MSSMESKGVAAVSRDLEGASGCPFLSRWRLQSHDSTATHRRGKQSNAHTIRGSVKSVILPLDAIPDVTQPKHRENPCREKETFLLHCHVGEVLLRRSWLHD